MSKREKRLRLLIEKCRVPPDRRLRLRDYGTAWGRRNPRSAYRKRELEAVLAEDLTRLSRAQELLYAANSWSVLLIFQAMDAAGKDSTIKHVMSGVNPQGCQVYSFKHPSTEELSHTYLWRTTKALPERGRIGIFNRSYYEDVLIVKVHPELLAAERIPRAEPSKSLWEARYDDINRFERHLVRNGTLILKFFLHVSKEEQRRRFLERIDEPEKHWKFSAHDVAERRYWKAYLKAYQDCLAATSTKWAPWYVIPADHKWVTRALVAHVVSHSIMRLGLKFPKITPEQRALIRKVRAELLRKSPRR